MTRAIFYAPMANPDAEAASGVPRMGVLLQRALKAAGVDVHVPHLPRTYDGRGDARAQCEARQASEEAGRDLLEQIRGGNVPRPDLWFSYHVYYKSPDWIGPRIAQELRIPYLAAECSHAPKRAGGPWALGHEGTTLALSAADRLLAMTAFDRVCLDRLAPGRVRDLKPFIDIAVFGDPSARNNAVPHLVAVGMMRNDRKRASYAMLAEALRLVADLPLKLTIAGDGVYRREVEEMFLPCPSPFENNKSLVAGEETLSSRKLGEPVAQQRPCETYYPGPRSGAHGAQSPGSRIADFSVEAYASGKVASGMTEFYSNGASARLASLHDVTFAGEVPSDRVPELLNSGDVFVWPGIGEAYGLVFLEAQAAGLPIVACRDRGVPDVTREGETALLSAPGDVAAYAANLRCLLTDHGLGQRFGVAARAFVHNERSIEAAGATLHSVLAELDLR